jgi:mRNA interferase RelE/StbE
MRYAVEVDTRAAREIRVLPRREQARVIEKVQALADNPRPAGSVKLSGASRLWRIRSGAYRIVYQIRDDRVLVTIVRVAHRREAYRGL